MSSTTTAAARRLKQSSSVPPRPNTIARIDAYLGVLAIVYANSFETMDATSPNNGYNLQMDNAGVTDPVWIGIVIQALTMFSWYCYVIGLLYTIASLFVSLQTGLEAKIAIPTALYIIGTFVYYICMFFEDAAFWFNAFNIQQRNSIMIDSPQNAYMYVVTEVQLLMFMALLTKYMYWIIPVLFKYFRERENSRISVFTVPT
jgi:hypothetical protein